MRRVFRGQILGVGSSSGTRVVVGRWDESPLGAFADVMIERDDGHRVLLAPSEAVRDFVADTYTFDETRIEAVAVDPVEVTGEWVVTTPSLTLRATTGRRTPLGLALRSVPRSVAVHHAWATMADPFARVLLRGVRTRGVARPGRREWYSALDHHAVTWMTGTLDGVDLGALRPVDPPCRFGFSSTPRRPSVTDVVTTIEETG